MKKNEATNNVGNNGNTETEIFEGFGEKCKMFSIILQSPLPLPLKALLFQDLLKRALSIMDEKKISPSEAVRVMLALDILKRAFHATLEKEGVKLDMPDFPEEVRKARNTVHTN